MDENSTNKIAKELRRKAEERLKNKELKSVKQLSLPEIEKLVHELKVYQIELELMNEELILENEIAETANDKYVGLYDFAPTGYFTLSAYGDIKALNLCGAKLLGRGRSSLINTRFSLFVSDISKPIFNQFLERTFKSNKNESCEITLHIADKIPVHLHITAIADPNKEQCLVDAVDITDSKLAEDKIKESEEKYRLLFDNMESGFELNQVIVDENNEPIDFRIIEGNKNLKEYTGFSIEEVKGKTIKEVNPNADINMIKKYGEVALTGIPFTLEYFSLTFNKYYKVATYSPQKGYFACIFNDTTERKLGEEKLKESEEKFRLMVDNSGLGVGYYSLDGIIQYFNQKALDNIGGKAEDYVGKSLIECFGEKNGKDYIKRYKEAINSDAALEFEDCIDTVNGKKWFYSNQTVIKDANGTIKGIQVLAKDITDRKLTEENVLESEEKYRELVENSPDSIAIYEEGKLLFVNNELVRLLAAKDKEELIGMSVLQFIHPDSKELVKERMMKVALDNATLPFIEEKALRIDGKAVDVEIKAIPIKLGGKYAVQLIIHDLTEKKQADLALQNANRLYSVLSNVNQAIFQIKDKLEIYREVCRIAIEDGGFRMAWIGEIDEQINKIVPIISAGYVNGYLDNVNIDLNDEKRSGGPTGRAAKTGEHYIAYDIANSPDMAIWKDQALQNGYFTSAAFPIKIFNKVIGAFTLYADASYSFNEEEINLLDLLAKDISNGIEFFEVDAIRHETLEALKESEEIQSLYMKHSPIYTYIKEVTSKESRVLKASDNFIDMIGVSSSDMIGKTMEELYPAEFAEKISQDDRDVVASGKMLEQEEELNGRVYITLKYPIIERGKRLLAGYTIDITKRKKAEEELKESMNDLQRFHKLTVGRELTMIELKKEVNALLKKTGQDEKYIIVE